MSERENIQQVASRLVGLRDALELTPEQVAEACGIEVETYRNYESGDFDIPISFIQNLASIYGVQVPELLFGTSPRMSSYYVTRAGKGPRVERSKAYSYESLAEGFTDRIMHPFLVTLEPNDNAIPNPTHTLVRSSTMCFRAEKNCTSAAKRWCLIQATALLSTPSSLTTCKRSMGNPSCSCRLSQASNSNKHTVMLQSAMRL